MLCRPQLLSLSVHGCGRMDKALWSHLNKCVCLDICGTDVCNTGEFSALIKVSVHLDFNVSKPVELETCKCKQ